MSKERMLEIIGECENPGNKSIVVYTKDYIYSLRSVGGDLETWKEAVFEFPGTLTEKDMPASKALALLIEELTQGLPGYFEEIPVNKSPGDFDKIKGMLA